MKNEESLLEVGTAKAIYFNDYNNLKPDQLIVFSKEYLDTLISLKNYLMKNRGLQVDLPFCRIKEDGSICQKIISGKIGLIWKSYFIFSSCEDFNSTYDEIKDFIIRFDNVLGVIPLYPNFSQTITPFNISLHCRSYLRSLLEMRKLLKECECSGKSSTLIYKGESGFKKFECLISKTNKSNVEIENYRKMTYANIDDLKFQSLLMNPDKKVCLFISPQFYLIGVSTTSSKHYINHYDFND